HSKALDGVVMVASDIEHQLALTTVVVSDTPCISVNMMKEKVLERLGSCLQKTSQPIQIHGIRDHQAKLEYVVCPDQSMPETVDILIGKPSFDRLGISLVVPSRGLLTAPSIPDLRRTESEMIRFGAPKYFGTLKRLSNCDKKDHDRQIYKY
ncbi:hypothetical protein FOL47_005249, partial [Perkinsus chesapeaki]